MITLYGIPNCDTVSKARKWLSSNEVDFQFHNFKKDGLTQNTLDKWIDELGWEVLLNKRGMTWRKLPDDAGFGRPTPDDGLVGILHQRLHRHHL